MYMYEAYERLPVQRTAGLSYMTPPRWNDGLKTKIPLTDSLILAHLTLVMMKSKELKT